MAENAVSPAELERLLRYAELTYRAVTEQRRRQAVVALVVGGVFAVVTVFAGLQWQSVRSQVGEVADADLVEALGIRIPDPRPAIQRGELRLKAFVWGVVTVGALVLTVLALAVHQMVRPSTPSARNVARERGPPALSEES